MTELGVCRVSTFAPFFAIYNFNSNNHCKNKSNNRTSILGDTQNATGQGPVQPDSIKPAFSIRLD